MISKEDKTWIVQKLKEFYKTDDVNWEYEMMEHGIGVHKPTNVREYVEKKLKEKEYDTALGKLSKEVFNIQLGDEQACDDLRKRIQQLLDKADNELPGFSKARAIMISEIYGDIRAVKTKGAMGSTRMVRSIHDCESKNHFLEQIKDKDPEEILSGFEEESNKLKKGQKTEAQKFGKAFGTFVDLMEENNPELIEKNKARISKIMKKLGDVLGIPWVGE